MPKKLKNSSLSLLLLFVLLLGAGGFLGITSWELGVSFVGSVLILVAFVETGLVLVGFSAFQRRHGKVEKAREE